MLLAHSLPCLERYVDLLHGYSSSNPIGSLLPPADGVFKWKKFISTSMCLAITQGVYTIKKMGKSHYQS